MSELGHAQLVNEHLQPLLCGKFAAVLAISADHGGQEVVESVVDLFGSGKAFGAALLPSFNDELECDQKYPLLLE